MKAYREALVSFLIILGIIVLVYWNFGPSKATATLLSGLTLASLYFLLGAGLSLIFGLMDVLNFAHGVIFMIGAYTGYTFFGNPRLILNTLPLFLALSAGVMAGTFLSQIFSKQNRVLALFLASIGLITLWWGLKGFPLRPLVAFEPTTPGGAIPTALAQEPLARMASRLGWMVLSGLLLSLGTSFWSKGKERPIVIYRRIFSIISLTAVAFLILLGRNFLEKSLLNLSVDLRFLLAMVAAVVVGAILGALIEGYFIRPFYGRPVAQIVLTLGLMFAGGELVKFIWGKEGRAPMSAPSLFATSCISPNLFAWFREHCSSIYIVGRAFPSYRLFIIFIGLLMFLIITLLLRYTRLGMIIRAGVQDSEMVEALGINVRRVFTIVFAIGSALAALGGVVAAPFVGVYPDMGGIFQLQAFIAVVIGGMGNYAGTAVGALILGLARAFGDTLVTTGFALPGMAQALKASPAIARASIVLVMALVLLVRPSGIFGKKG
jgi:branched-chain amino acid transport system permease protein